MDSKQNQTRRRINVSKSLFDCSRGRLTKVGAKDHSGRFPSRAKKGKLLMGNFVKPYLNLSLQESRGNKDKTTGLSMSAWAVESFIH